MKSSLYAACVGVLAFGLSTALAAEPASPGKLDWARKPTGDDVARFYPEKGKSTYTSGRAILDCDVTAAGLLEACRVVEETPRDYGFGEGALKLSRIFRLDPKTVDINDPNRNRVVMPIVFALPGKPMPPSGYMAGQNAMAVTVGAKPDKSVVSCPTADRPDQFCVFHALQWKEQPELQATLPALDGVDMTSGTTMLQCSVTPQSRLTGCVAGGNPTPATRKAMLAIADMLVAPAKTADGAPVGEGPVIIPFDWAKITPLAQALKRP